MSSSQFAIETLSIDQSLSYDHQSCSESNKKFNKTTSYCIPINFKAMILLQTFKKYSAKSKLQSKDDQNLKKKAFLMQWFFKTFKNQIISNTIQRTLCQQNISKATVFYRFKQLFKHQNRKNFKSQSCNQDQMGNKITKSQNCNEKDQKKYITKEPSQQHKRKSSPKHDDMIKKNLGNQFKKLNEIMHQIDQAKYL